MRTKLVLRSPLAVVALCAVAVSPPGAQQTIASNNVRSPVKVAAVSDAPLLRPVGTYRFVEPRYASMPTDVTVADSSGTLVASFRLPGESAAHHMTVDVLDAGIVLQGQTPSGVLTLVINSTDLEPAGSVIG